MSKIIEIYTDGACSGNPGPGGWGAILLCGEYKKEISGGDADTTNNRMEMMAVVESLQLLKKRYNVKLYTDSKYVIQGVTEWMDGWKAKGWKNASKQPVKNKDLWQKIDSLVSKHSVEFIWVKGHSGNAGNERADELARLAIPQRRDI